ncbi:MAG TPA: SRPBCC family protein [Humisphaera sp.]
MSTPTEPTADRELAATRVFDAPRDLVFKMFTDPAHLARWWGPRGFTTTTHAMAFEPGGVWRFTMHGPDGRDYGNQITYTEIRPNELIAYRHGGDDKALEPVNFSVSARFEDAPGGKTALHWRMVFPSKATKDFVVREYGADRGMVETINRLEEVVAETTAGPGDAFVITRTFDAPRDVVFAAWTKADHLAKWFGPVGFTMISAKPDLATGVVFHYGMRSPGGQEMWGKWAVREVLPPKSIVIVASFSDPAGNTTRAPFFADWPLEVLSVLTFEDAPGGRTTMTMRGLPLNATPAERARFVGHHDSMRGGWGGTLEQFAKYLANG